jgi:uncharacterized LabA/DUF88 family protein
MSARLMVFIDYQNTYMSARRTFGYMEAENWHGQVHPRSVGELIASRYQTSPVELKQVRVYRGRPSNKHDRQGYAAFQRQFGVWQKTNLVEPISRGLRYPATYPNDDAEEKGIDVLLALDFVVLALRDEYDIGVIFSHDTDLVPALEQATAAGKTPCVASWQPDTGYGHSINVKGSGVLCHWLPRVDYHRIKDTRDYNVEP